MAVLNAQPGNSVLNNNQSVAFLGNGLPHGNPSNTLHLTSSATKINENAVLNRPNNMVSGNSQNTIHGIKNNVLQGSRPDASLLADFSNRYTDKSKGTVPAYGTASTNGVADDECQSPRKSPANVWKNGSWVPSLGNAINGAGCGCYVSTGINPFTIAATLGGLGILARLGLNIKRIKSAKAAVRKLNLDFQRIREAGRQNWIGTFRSAWMKANPGQEFKAAQEALAVTRFEEVRRELGGLKVLAQKYLDDLGTIDGEILAGSHLAKQLQRHAILEALGGGALPFITSAAMEAAGLAENFTLYREVDCKGDNTKLNEETCNCDCTLAGSQSFTTQSSEICYSPGAVSYFDQALDILVNEIPGFNNLLSGPEVEGCYLPCQCAESQKTDSFGNQLCGCFCNEHEFGFSDKVRNAYGIHADAADDCPFEMTLNTSTCCCECPAGSDVKEGRTMPALARLSDNLSDASVGSTGHYLYQTGCNFVCDGRDYVGTWPPDCGEGSTFDASKNVCACRPNAGFCCGTCTQADNPSEGASCDGCTGCCIYDPASGVAGWDGYYCLTYTVTGSPTGDDCYGCEFGGTPDSEGDCQYLASEIGDC